jgi:hypothetical protein
MNQKQMQERIAALEAERDELKAKANGKVTATVKAKRIKVDGKWVDDPKVDVIELKAGADYPKRHGIEVWCQYAQHAPAVEKAYADGKLDGRGDSVTLS